jgi:PTH2 family peptidyl-tRNA hydrolase
VNFKQVIVVRKDLKMGIGKTSAQAAHAAVLAVEECKRVHSAWLGSWFAEGQPKIVVKVNTLDELLWIKTDAKKSNLPVVIVEDKGLTQIPEGTLTCLGIGPAPSNLVDKITNKLKLL